MSFSGALMLFACLIQQIRFNASDEEQVTVRGFTENDSRVTDKGAESERS